MKSQPITYLTCILLAIGLSVISGPPIFAGIALLNTIDAVAHQTESGRQVVVTGPIACTAGERVTLHVTVTQRSSGVAGQGRTRFSCTGALQRWEVWITHDKKAAFAYGVATAVAFARTTVAFARTTAQGTPTDAHQWFVEVTVTD